MRLALLACANTGLSPYWHAPIRAWVALLACANTGSVSPYWHAPIRALVVRCVRAKALAPCFLGVRIRCARFSKALYSGFGVVKRRLIVADIAPIWDRLFPIGFVIRD